jgi:hypothetical protein
MSQQLIVEGKDAIVIANLLKKKGLRPPLGYNDPLKFREEFTKNVNGYNNVENVLSEALDDPSLSNIGVIIDANAVGADSRWQSLESFLKNSDKVDLSKIDRPGGGRLIRGENLNIGIWIMPDNNSTGYLEHFLETLIPNGDGLLKFVDETLSALDEKGLKKFSAVKEQKAKLHTWLAWQEEPGKPFGTAVESRYFDANSHNLNGFVDWFKATFVLAP